MKKLLSALAATLIVSSSAATVVSCGSKPVDSLSANMIGDKLGYDITNWDASVLTPADFKTNFLANVNDQFTNGGSTTSLQKLLLVNDGDKHAPTEGTNMVAQILATYESKQANQNIHVQKLDVKKAMADFNVTIYDENNKDTQIASWNGSEWDLKSDLTIKSFKDESGQYVYQTVNLVNFAVEITPVGSADSQTWNSDNFVGAKTNLTKDLNTKTDKYYNDAVKNSKDDIKNQAALYSNKEWKSEKDHDYRYMIEFNFSAQ